MLVDLLIIGLAGWRVANFLIDEDGPVGIAEKLRNFVGVKPGPVGDTFLTQLFTCIYCMSVHTTWVCFLIWLIEPTIVLVIAAMTIPLIINRFMQRE